MKWRGQAWRLDVKEGVVARPGDTLVLSVSGMTEDKFHALADRIREAVPEDIRVMIVAGVEQVAVTRGEKASSGHNGTSDD